MVSQSRPYLYAHRTAQKRQPPERLAIPVLRVDVQGSELVITASDSNYVMTYHEPANAPKLLAKTFPRKKTGVPWRFLFLTWRRSHRPGEAAVLGYILNSLPKVRSS